MVINKDLAKRIALKAVNRIPFISRKFKDIAKRRLLKLINKVAPMLPWIRFLEIVWLLIRVAEALAPFLKLLLFILIVFTVFRHSDSTFVQQTLRTKDFVQYFFTQDTIESHPNIASVFLNQTFFTDYIEKPLNQNTFDLSPLAEEIYQLRSAQIAKAYFCNATSNHTYFSPAFYATIQECVCNTSIIGDDTTDMESNETMVEVDEDIISCALQPHLTTDGLKLVQSYLKRNSTYISEISQEYPLVGLCPSFGACMRTLLDPPKDIEPTLRNYTCHNILPFISTLSVDAYEEFKKELLDILSSITKFSKTVKRSGNQICDRTERNA